MTNSLKGHIALFFAQIVYALNYSIAKDLMPDFISPVALVFLRIVGACALFWLLSVFYRVQVVEKKDLFKMAWLACFGVVINQLFFIYGLSLTKPINSAIIMISNPVIVFVFTLLLLKERITFFKFSGLVLAIAGATTLLLFRGNFQFGSETLRGDFLTLINSTSWAIFVVLVKPVMLRYNTVTAMRWMFLFGTIYMIPIGLKDALSIQWAEFTPHAVFAVCFVVIATTFFAYLLNIYGLQHLSPNTVSAYIYLQPFLAGMFAILLGKDQLTFTKLFSGGLIITGLYLINMKSKTANYD